MERTPGVARPARLGGYADELMDTDDDPDNQEDQGDQEDQEEQGDPDPDDYEPDNPIDELVQLLGLTEEEAAVEVSRYRRGGGIEYLCRFSLPEFDLEELREQHGGGRYRCVLRGERGKYLGSKTIRIAGTPKEPAPERVPAKPPEPDPDASVVDLVTGMRQEMRRFLDEVRRPPPQTAEASPVGMAIALLSAIQEGQKPYIEAMMQRTQPDNSMRSAMDVILSAMEFARDSSPPNPEAGLASHLALPALQLMQRLVDKEDRPAPRHQENAPVESLNSVAGSRRPPWAFVLQPWLNALQRWASAGKNAEARAEFVLDELPEDMVPIVSEQLSRGGEFLTEFFALFPDARPFEAWYTRFWHAMADQFDWGDQEEPEDNDTNAGGPDPGR